MIPPGAKQETGGADSVAAPVSECHGRAVALTTFQRPVGNVTGYVVACECGWESQITSDWRKSLDGHYYREEAKRRAAAA